MCFIDNLTNKDMEKALTPVFCKTKSLRKQIPFFIRGSSISFTRGGLFLSVISEDFTENLFRIFKDLYPHYNQNVFLKYITIFSRLCFS